MRSVKSNLGVRAALLVGCATLAMPAWAQDAASQTDAFEADAIVVTAQKREQNILDVPVAVSALNSELLDVAQVNDFADVAALAPSLTIAANGNKNQNTISLRGIGTFSFSTAVEASVLVVVDDVALLQPGQAFGNLTDIARIEVLRGPQGTLFGKSASAGVVNIVTQSPTSTFSGAIEGMATSDEEFRVQGMVSGPIGTEGGFRINGFVSDYAGHMRNLTTGNKLGAEKAWGLRGKFEYDFGGVDLTLVGDYAESESNGGADSYLRADKVKANGSPANPSIDLAGITPGVGNNKVRNNDESVNDVEQLLLSGKVDVDVGFATLSSITSYQRWNYYAENDQDQSADPNIFQISPYDARQFAQELRLTSPDTGQFDYIFGLYYSHGVTDRSFTRITAPYLSSLRQNWNATSKTTSYAAFTQLGYDISEKTRFNLGARLNREEISVRFDDNRTTPGVRYAGNDAETKLTGKASLQHFFDNGLMAFGSVATGYKGQAYDVSSGFDQRRANTPIKSESSINYEIGIKGRAFGNRGQFQLVAFWTDYDNFQAQGINNELLIPQFELTNVGKLRTRGIEFEGSVKPSQNLMIFGSAAYIDAKVREFADAECYFGQTAAQGCVRDPASGQFVQDLAGKGMPNSPDFKFNIGFNADQPLGGDAVAFVNGNYTWQSAVNYSLTQNPRTVQEAYGIANAAIGVRGVDNGWKVSLFVNNLFDKAYSSRIIDDTNARNDPYILLQQVPRNYKRYVGIQGRFGF